MVEIDWLEAIGWLSAILFVASFLVKNRSTLHLLGAVACIFKLIYSYEHAVWPLFANWVILIVVQTVQFFRLRV